MDAVKYLETRKRMSLSGDLSLVHLAAVQPLVADATTGRREFWMQEVE